MIFCYPFLFIELFDRDGIRVADIDAEGAEGAFIFVFRKRNRISIPGTKNLHRANLEAFSAPGNADTSLQINFQIDKNAHCHLPLGFGARPYTKAWLLAGCGMRCPYPALPPFVTHSPSPPPFPGFCGPALRSDNPRIFHLSGGRPALWLRPLQTL